MGNRSIVPYGPQHPVLPEPIHLDLVLEDEKVLAAIPSIGFIHRGLESLTSKKDFNEMVYVAEATELFVMPYLTAIALIVVVAFTSMGPVYFVLFLVDFRF